MLAASRCWKRAQTDRRLRLPDARRRWWRAAAWCPTRAGSACTACAVLRVEGACGSAGSTALALAAVAGREYGEPYLVLGLADVRGLVGPPDMKVDGRSLALESGTRALSERLGGVHANLPHQAGAALPASHVSANFRLAGTQSLGIAPVADDNRITRGFGWPHPLFGGRFLPSKRTIGAKVSARSGRSPSLASAAQSQLEKGSRAADPVGGAKRASTIWTRTRRRPASTASRSAWSIPSTSTPRPIAPASTASCSSS